MSELRVNMGDTRASRRPRPEPPDTLRIDRNLVERALFCLQGFEADPVAQDLERALMATNPDFCPGCARRGTTIERLRGLVRRALPFVVHAVDVPVKQGAAGVWLLEAEAATAQEAGSRG